MTGTFKGGGGEIFNCLFVIKRKSWLTLLWIAGNNSLRTFTGLCKVKVWVCFSLGCSARSAICDPLRLLLSFWMHSNKSWNRIYPLYFAYRQNTRKKKKKHFCYQNISVSKRRYLENLWREFVGKIRSGQINACFIKLLDPLVKLTLN